MKKEQLTQFNRGQSSRIFKRVATTGEPLVVMQHNTAVVVILSAEKYCELAHTNITVDVSFYGPEKETE